MVSSIVDKLVAIGFSEYEAKAYIALLRDSPATGYQISKSCGVPRSMIYEVMDKLIARGAAMTLRSGRSTKYAPVPAVGFFDQLRDEHEQLISSLKGDLGHFASVPDLDYVWNLEGHDSIMARAREMIDQAEDRAYLALLPATFGELRPALVNASSRGVRVVVYTTSGLDLPGGRVVVLPTPEQALGNSGGLGLVLVIDGRELLIGEWLTATQARASWSSSRLLVFVAEHHLRTDLYLPQLLTLLGARAMGVIREEDRELFAQALESHIKDDVGR